MIQTYMHPYICTNVPDSLTLFESHPLPSCKRVYTYEYINVHMCKYVGRYFHTRAKVFLVYIYDWPSLWEHASQPELTLKAFS